MNNFKLNLKTPVKTYFSEDAYSVAVTTSAGRITILPGHIDLTGNILFSDVIIKHGDVENEFFVRNGVIHVDKKLNTVEVLCMSIKERSEIDCSDIENYIQWIDDRLKHEGPEGKVMNEYQYRFLDNEKVCMVKKLKEFKGPKKR